MVTMFAVRSGSREVRLKESIDDGGREPGGTFVAAQAVDQYNIGRHYDDGARAVVRGCD